MNINNARRIHCTIAKLAELSAFYHARFGNHHRITADSPTEAVELYQAFMNEQGQLASLLDNKALAAPYTRWEKWWEHRAVMSIALVNELSEATLRLLEHIAYLEAMGKNPDNETSVCSLQETIAGMLHPQAREAGQSSIGGYQEAV